METEVKTTKVCTKCGVEKDFAMFAKSKKNKDGLQYTCSGCQSKFFKEYRRENADALNNKHKEYYQKNKNSFRERAKLWEQNNRQKIREIKRQWRENNPEKAIKATREWQKNNPEKKRENDRRWQGKNREKRSELSKKWSKKNTLDVSEYYVKSVLRQKGFRKEDITDELINVQQLIIKTKRLCKT